MTTATMTMTTGTTTGTTTMATTMAATTDQANVGSARRGRGGRRAGWLVLAACGLLFSPGNAAGETGRARPGGKASSAHTAPAADPVGVEPEAGPAATATAPGAKPALQGKVNVNTASEAELIALPGIGPAKAAAIVAARTKTGRFRRVDDLVRVKGIGRKTMERLRPLVLVDGGR